MKKIFLSLLLIVYIDYCHSGEEYIENLASKIPILNNLVKPKLRGFQTLTTPCTCGVFLEGQLTTNARIKNNENPIFSKEMDLPLFPCGVQGNKQCLKKCIDMVFNYMPNLGPLACASIERDCVKEKPFLFTKNCEDTWRNTGFSAGKEFCCSSGLETKCRAGVSISQLQRQNVQPNLIADVLAGSDISQKTIPEIFVGFVDRATHLASNVLNNINIKH